jgi:hypothetical protein
VSSDELQEQTGGSVADTAFLATIVAFFLLCVGYVAVCGRIIGPDDIARLDIGADEPVNDEILERAA